ncbi:hypothetical protein [Pseudomonas sp. H3(2019)]|uniref:DUF7683 domain-containing protein n=1 Tax=Pseudomonas sp. H3(2019) TaxID=2598724 RepID=UPI001195748B|nr:hypothetical protein [Pseudomonas sp. H3(2019)]TVT80621.1 hypothetical protein FPT12_22750 [Pseudomonas sp. H3(2019)]
MIYLVEAFDKVTELLVFEEELPKGCDEQLRAIMGWTTDQQGWEGYDLSKSQLSAIEEMLGKQIYDSAYLYQLSCNA